MVKLNAKNVMIANNDKIQQMWADFMLRVLNENITDKYNRLKSKDLVGVYMIVFVKDSILHRIKKVQSDNVKTGLGGKLGNKGAVIIKFFVDDSNLCFINCHLESGSKNSLDRLRNISEIH